MNVGILGILNSYITHLRPRPAGPSVRPIPPLLCTSSRRRSESHTCDRRSPKRCGKHVANMQQFIFSISTFSWFRITKYPFVKRNHLNDIWFTSIWNSIFEGSQTRSPPTPTMSNSGNGTAETGVSTLSQGMCEIHPRCLPSCQCAV